MVQLLPNRVHFRSQPRIGGGFNPSVDTLENFLPKVRGGFMPHHQEIGKLLTAGLHEKSADACAALLEGFHKASPLTASITPSDSQSNITDYLELPKLYRGRR